MLIRLGARHPLIIDSSRRTGRKFWVGFLGDPFSPSEECKEIWSLAITRWKKVPGVGHSILKYIQTTPEIKLRAYKELLPKDEDGWNSSLREAVLESCEAVLDKELLKLGYEDPEEKCREIALKRIGEHSWVLNKGK
jgi:hypothetical protein